jgi:hypothetical protein
MSIQQLSEGSLVAIFEIAAKESKIFRGRWLHVVPVLMLPSG